MKSLVIGLVVGVSAGAILLLAIPYAFALARENVAAGRAQTQEAQSVPVEMGVEE